MEGRDNVPKPPPKKLAVALASLSAMVAETTTFPIDITKTRLQLIDSPSTRLASTFRVASEIVLAQGPLGLYQGLSPALLRHLFYTPVRIVGYEHLRERFVIGDSSSTATHSNGGFFWILFQFGVFNSRPVIELLTGSSYLLEVGEALQQSLHHNLSGLPLIVQVVASPADLVKVRMQADGRMISQGLQPRYLGPLDALNKIFQREGLGGLWKGVFPNVQRAFLVNMGELTCYDNAKSFIIEKQIASDNIYAHTLASIVSGLSATALSCPADVVKTRMMNQAVNEEGQVKYKNSFDCLVKTVRLEGSRALWKGFFPTWARLGPWQFVFWVSYEKFRQIAGLTSF
ncbi:hypothetical protein RJ639_002435 [Escallonia herrerae]|uniref:Mitochondrial uncoupling protein 3 n=1 Tax=Escallonia herrerae TaxID=1293975 RepID=A0AA89BFZ1_9ASTE|nr:hypothetical protein RJ639_002435 [Escallonia herrerae]